jgi:hypothetical protein
LKPERIRRRIREALRTFYQRGRWPKQLATDVYINVYPSGIQILRYERWDDGGRTTIDTRWYPAEVADAIGIPLWIWALSLQHPNGMTDDVINSRTIRVRAWEEK